MYRNVILEFLSLYREQLNSYRYKQMTISLLGRFEISDISSLVLRPDEVLTYHIKEPRIYEKSYSFETFSKTIGDMIVYSKEKVFLSKNDITSSIDDPFYLKDIRNIPFQSIVMFPILKKEEVVGTIIFYFEDIASKFNIKNSDLVKLFDALQSSQGKNINHDINEMILENEDYSKIVLLKNTNKCYVDNNLKSKFHFKNNLISLSDSKIKSRINKEIKNKRYHHIELRDFDVYYISKYDYKLTSNELDLLALDAINEHKFNDFSLIFIENKNLDFELINHFSDANIKKHHVNDNLLVYMIDQILASSFIKEFNNNQFDSYKLIVTSKTITSKMNLCQVAKYIDEFRPTTFNFSEYVKYVNNINSISLSDDVTINLNYDKKFINSVTKEEFCVLPNIINFNVISDTEMEVYEKTIYKLVKNNLENEIIDYIIPIIPKMLNTKKLTLLIDKLKELPKLVKVIISIPNNKISVSEIEKGILKLKKQGVLVFVDSSIYLNNNAMYLLDFCDGVFIHKNEFEMLLKYPSGINTAIYQYMVKNHKELIIDYEYSKVDDAYYNSLFYYYK